METTTESFQREYNSLMKQNPKKVHKEIDSLKIKVSDLHNQLDGKVQLCTKMYNTVLKDLCDTISTSLPNNQVLGTYAGFIDNLICNKPNEPISMFLMYIYKNDLYRQKLLDKDDTFFINDNYEDDIGSDSQTINTMFQFKQYWKDMDYELQDYIKDTMITMVNIAEQYIEFKTDVSDLNAMLKNMHVN